MSNNNGIVEFDQPWLSQAIPLSNRSFENCLRFEVNRSIPIESGQCLDSYFNRAQTRKCDDFVFKTDERNIQNEVSVNELQLTRFRVVIEIFFLCFEVWAHVRGLIQGGTCWHDQ